MEHEINVLYYLHVKLKFELVIKGNKKTINSDLVYKHKGNELIGGRFFFLCNNKNLHNFRENTFPKSFSSISFFDLPASLLILVFI